MVGTTARPTSTMDLYMADVKQYPLLDAEQEVALAQQYARGKAAARQLHDSSDLDASKQRALKAAIREGEQARGVPVILLIEQGE